MTGYNSDSDDQERPLDDQPIQEKTKKTFSDAIFNVLNEPVVDKPILSKKRQLEKSIDKEKLLLKQQKLNRHEKRKEDSWVQPEFNQNELALKKLATKGVVQLFNAIKNAQKIATKEPAEQTKKVFLDTIKQNSQTAKEPITVAKGFE